MALSPDVTAFVREIIALLSEKQETISTAESLTAGGLSSALTSVPGSSEVFLGGITAYQNSVKSAQLGVLPELIEKHSVVSQEVAEAMANGARNEFGSTWAIATTGVAGPGPSEGVEPGTVWLAIVGPESQSIELSLAGDRDAVRSASVSSAIATFARILRHRKKEG